MYACMFRFLGSIFPCNSTVCNTYSVLSVLLKLYCGFKNAVIDDMSILVC